MTDIGPGTPLICIDASNGYYSNGKNLTAGALYFVKSIFAIEGTCFRDNCGTFINLTTGQQHLCPNRFRPLNNGDTSLVENEKEDDSPIVKVLDLV